ncbi:ABC transporter ATP-binding protein, partial [Actinotignum timonense]|uniref:ABC transporter ATP-binding protein n=2 Tax=Actinomycetaceae TaxID=2049 RepID=UPI002A7FE3A4
RGQVLIDGADMTAVPTHRRGVGMVFQDGQLFPNRSVGGNIAYGIEKGRSRAEVAAEVERWLELVELSGYAERAVTTLSGGQAQRVALARSLAARPRVLLLDEPLSALDTRLREDLAVFLRRVLQKAGTTAVYVTHNDAEAATVADRVVRMDSGRLVAASE